MLAVLVCAPCACLPDGLGTSAEYIVGFVRYVHWDGEDGAEAWHICIVGNVPVEQDRVYADEIVRGKRFVVRRVAADDALANCHVLDLTAVDATTSTTMLLRTRHLPILSVGSGSEFCSEGGQMCLHMTDRSQKFEINLSAVKESGLNVSARLLMLGAGHSAPQGNP